MATSTSRRQLRLGAALIAANLLLLPMSAALAESSKTKVTSDPRRTSARPVAHLQQQVVPHVVNARIAAAEGNTLNTRKTTTEN